MSIDKTFDKLHVGEVLRDVGRYCVGFFVKDEVHNLPDDKKVELNRTKKLWWPR
jgi:hypothetical protein